MRRGSVFALLLCLTLRIECQEEAQQQDVWVWKSSSRPNSSRQQKAIRGITSGHQSSSPRQPFTPSRQENTPPRPPSIFNVPPPPPQSQSHTLRSKEHKRPTPNRGPTITAFPHNRGQRLLQQQPPQFNSFPPFLPFFTQPPPVRTNSQVAPDGTTKSRVVADTLLSGNPQSIDNDEKYTTLDKLRQERGPPPPRQTLQAKQQEDLGGLHPEEVFYADDDLVIIKGGGFNSGVLSEPSQPLDADITDPESGLHSSSVSSVVAPPFGLPDPNQEYNGNIPAILPPPNSHALPPQIQRQQTQQTPISIYVPQHLAHFLYSPSTQTSVYVPWMYPVPSVNSNHIGAPNTPIRRQQQVNRPMRGRPQRVSAALRVPHSQAIPLTGDTDVNFLHPRPPVNPDAEVFQPLSPRPQYQPHGLAVIMPGVYTIGPTQYSVTRAVVSPIQPLPNRQRPRNPEQFGSRRRNNRPREDVEEYVPRQKQFQRRPRPRL